MTVQFGMRPQIMGWPLRVGGDIRQTGSAAGLYLTVQAACARAAHPHLEEMVTEADGSMRQYAPFPQELADLVAAFRYRPGWRVYLRDMERDPANTHGAAAGGLTLVVYADVYDTYHPDQHRPVNHFFSVPAATYNRASWLRWLRDRILDVEKHEACEWFVIKTGRGPTRPFAPTHGPGDDPYALVEYATDEQRRTSFRGELNP